PFAVEEVRVIANTPPAEYGRATGVIISVVTRGGTKKLHGTLSWFHNSNLFNSRSNLDKAGGLETSPLRIENQFSGTVGGPIVRGKTFYFGSFQRWTDRNRLSGSTISSAPTEIGRALLRTNGGTRPTTQ